MFDGAVMVACKSNKLRRRFSRLSDIFGLIAAALLLSLMRLLSSVYCELMRALIVEQHHLIPSECLAEQLIVSTFQTKALRQSKAACLLVHLLTAGR